MSYAVDLTGQRFGRLVVLSRNRKRQEEEFRNSGLQIAFWDCMCDCGNMATVKASNLKNKTNPTLSCGCFKNERIHAQKNTKENEWEFDGDIAICTTTSGERFIVDKCDYDTVRKYCWHISNASGYVVANSRDKTNRSIFLHRLILNVSGRDTFVDHINWDKSDNRRINLRVATKSENNTNIKRKANNSTGYTGVTLNKRTGRYIARISKNGKRILLGTFDEFEDAVTARHEAEVAMHGEWSGELNRKDFEKIMNTDRR